MMRSRGTDAEHAAENWLKKHKLKLVTRNFSCRMGEIDLIMRDGNTLCFIEVRLRASTGFGGAAASVTVAKQRKIIHTAQAFLQKHPQYQQDDCRFDVIAYETSDTSTAPIWYKGAFTS